MAIDWLEKELKTDYRLGPEVLRVTPTYLDQYIAAARDVTEALRAVEELVPVPGDAAGVRDERDETVVDHAFDAARYFVVSHPLAAELGDDRLEGRSGGMLQRAGHAACFILFAERQR
jgi:hypothetical protein